jgi:hypothetical protein
MAKNSNQAIRNLMLTLFYSEVVNLSSGIDLRIATIGKPLQENVKHLSLSICDAVGRVVLHLNEIFQVKVVHTMDLIWVIPHH